MTHKLVAPMTPAVLHVDPTVTRPTASTPALPWLEKHRACNLEWAQSLGSPTLGELWAACPDPKWMLWALDAAGVQDTSADRLFACWCCRQVWPLLTDERSRRAVLVAERFARGEATRTELAAARDTVRNTARGAAQDAAWATVRGAARDAAWTAAWATVRNIALAAQAEVLAAQAEALRGFYPDPFASAQQA